MSIVEIVALVVALVSCAVSVTACYAAWRAVQRLRSNVSMSGELHEIRDYMQKLDAWSKRINARLVMEARRSDPAATEPTNWPPGDLKARLRRQAGIVPGQPAKHRE